MRVSLVWAGMVVMACGQAGKSADGGSHGGGAATDGGTAAQGGAIAHGGGGASANAGTSANAGSAMTGDAGSNQAGTHTAGSDAGGMLNDGGAATEGGTATQGGAPGCAFSDTFTGASLDPCWSVLNGTAQMPLITLGISGGALHLAANGNLNGVWYQGSTKSLVYKLVNASAFRVTTTVRPRKATDLASLPTKDLHVGGLMLRDPASAGGATERYLLFMAGHSENNNGMVHQGVELKSTVNGCSNWNEPDWGATATEQNAELRACRIGAAFRFYKRVPSAPTWTPATPPASTCAGNVVQGDVVTRADLPVTLQVGLGLNFSNPSDLDVAVDAIDLVTLPANATAADCVAD
jgi:hypothetical protein